MHRSYHILVDVMNLEKKRTWESRVIDYQFDISA